jgi:hypothetical protein
VGGICFFHCLQYDRLYLFIISVFSMIDDPPYCPHICLQYCPHISVFSRCKVAGILLCFLAVLFAVSRHSLIIQNDIRFGPYSKKKCVSNRFCSLKRRMLFVSVDSYMGIKRES